MLSTPEYGWTEFSLRHLKFSVSNVFSPLPQGWIRETIRGLENEQPFVVWGWCEPEYIFCTVTNEFCYLAYANDDNFHKVFKFADMHLVQVKMLEFCQMLHDDISRDIDSLVNWVYNPYPDEETTEQEIIEEQLKIKNEIQTLLNRLNLLIAGQKNLRLTIKS